MIKTALSLLLADQHILQPMATVMNRQLVHGVPNIKWLDGCFECTGFLTFANMFWAEKSINFFYNKTNSPMVDDQFIQF